MNPQFASLKPQRRQVVGVVLASVLLLALVACGQDSGTAAGGGGGGGSGGEGEGGFTPDQPVTMIVPFAAGGGSDILGRAMAAGIEEVREGVTVTVENRVGGDGAVGYSFLLQQEGNPHYLLAAETSALAVPLTADVPFTYEDFTPIAVIAEDNTLLVVAGGSEFQTIDDVVQATESGRVTAGISASTGLDNIVLSLLERSEGVEFERVVYDSGGELVAALLGGDIQVASLNPGEVIGQLEAGELRAIVAFSPERYEGELLADVPTAVEEGIDVTFGQFRGPFAAGGITDEQRAYWEETFRLWTETESYDEYMETNSLNPAFITGEELQQYFAEQQADLEEVFAEVQG